MKLSKDLLETWQGMIDYGTGGFDIFKIIEDAAKEAEQLESRISALEFDTKPLTREELETVLKEDGWSVGVPLNDWYIVNSNLEWGDSNDTCYVTDNANLQIQHFGGSYCIPLSAVTLATLRSCGVIK